VETNKIHIANPQSGPPAGNPDGNSPVPLEAGPEDVSDPDHIVGNGTPERRRLAPPCLTSSRSTP